MLWVFWTQSCPFILPIILKTLAYFRNNNHNKNVCGSFVIIKKSPYSTITQKIKILTKSYFLCIAIYVAYEYSYFILILSRFSFSQVWCCWWTLIILTTFYFIRSRHPNWFSSTIVINQRLIKRPFNNSSTQLLQDIGNKRTVLFKWQKKIFLPISKNMTKKDLFWCK